MVRFLQIVVASSLIVFGASFGWMRPGDSPTGTAAAQGGTAPGSDANPIEEPKTPPKKKKAVQKKAAAKKKAAPKGPDTDTGPSENR